MVKRRVHIAFTRLSDEDGGKFMVSVRTRDYSVFVCPFCGNVVPTRGGYKHLSTHGVQSSKLSSKLTYTVVMHADEDTVRGLAVLLNAYLTTSGYRLLMGKRVVGVGKHVFATLASLIREKPNVFADVFMQIITLAALTIPISDSAAIYVFKFGSYMTLYVGYDFATGSIAMIEKDGDVLYTRGTNADSLAKRVYDLITERREMWRRKWRQRSEKRQVVSNAASSNVSMAPSGLAMFERLVKEGGEEARKTFEKLVRGDFKGLTNDTRTSK